VSADENMATIKAIYDAFGHGDLDAILERCADNVDWASDVASAAAPWRGAKHGKAELPSLFAGIAQSGTVNEFTPLSFASNNDGGVMVFLRWSFTATATGKTLTSNLHHYWRLRDGKVTTIAAPRTALRWRRSSRPDTGRRQTYIEAPISLIGGAVYAAWEWHR
jgi:ketosteroid isomerase-like protein